MQARILSGRQMGPIEFMTRIEKPFVKMGKLQAPKNSYLVKNHTDGPMKTLLVNRQFRLIHTLNPVRSDVQEIPMYYESWEFFRRPSRELNKVQIMVGHFTAAAVTRQLPGASQLLKEPQPVRPPE